MSCRSTGGGGLTASFAGALLARELNALSRTISAAAPTRAVSAMRLVEVSFLMTRDDSGKALRWG